MDKLNSTFYKLNIDDSQANESTFDWNGLFDEMHFEGIDPDLLIHIDSVDDSNLGNFITNLDIITIEKLKEIFGKRLINLSYSEISEDIFLGKYNNWNMDLDEFRLTYATKDDILDKINESGIESLDEIDIKILEK